MAEVQREERAATAAERSVVMARAARRRRGVERHASGGGDALALAVLAVPVVLAAHLLFDEAFPRWMLTAFGAALFGIGLYGWRRQRTAKAAHLGRLDDAARAQAERVEELRFTTRRVMAVSDPHGEGETYWLCELPSGAHVVLAGSAWDVAEVPPVEWRSDVALVIDGAGMVVHLALTGEPVEVDRRDVREPEFEVTSGHRFWEPQADLALPGVVEDLHLERG